MQINFFRRFRIAPGLWLNFSKRSVSATVGVRGLKATVGPKGKRITAGLTGSGLSVSQRFAREKQKDASVGRRLLDKALGGKGSSRR